MRTVLVTGGGGFVGLGVVRALRRMGIRTVVVGRHRYPSVEELGALSLVGDIRDREFMVRACENIDTVFHVAAKAGVWGKWDDYFGINVSGTENVLAACRENLVSRLVYTSTPSVVFNRGHLHGVDETAPYATDILCHYARTKIMAEILVLAANGPLLKTTALRPHLVWGPGDTHLIPRLLERGRAGRLRIVGTGRNKVDISYIDNVVDAHIQAAINLERYGTAAGEAFFISQGEPVRLWEWINELFRQLAIPPVVKAVGFDRAYAMGFLLEKIYALLRIRQEPLMTRFVAEQFA
nr:NAD-dependent epimerase/dehydratase family protein [Deltaproteobacteria bacterium]